MPVNELLGQPSENIQSWIGAQAPTLLTRFLDSYDKVVLGE